MKGGASLRAGSQVVDDGRCCVYEGQETLGVGSIRYGHSWSNKVEEL